MSLWQKFLHYKPVHVDCRSYVGTYRSCVNDALVLIILSLVGWCEQ